MASIFPEPHAGGLPVRDAAGNPANPPGVERAYSPAPGFVSNCDILGLPSDCTARIEPRQVNAVVSEIIALAECWDPDGPWDCTILQNLCSTFNTWVTNNLIYIGDTPNATANHKQLWWESDTGNLFIRYHDIDGTRQWVQIAGPEKKLIFDGYSIIGAGNLSDPYRVGYIDCGVY